MRNGLIILAFASLASPAFAQFHLGLVSGVNQSYWTWNIKSLNRSLDYEPAMGWRVAIVGEWQWKPSMSIRAEFATHVKANKSVRKLLFETDIIAGNFDGSIWTFYERYQYLEGSALWQISPLKKIKPFYLLMGGTIGYMGSAWLKSEGTEASVFSSKKSPKDLSDPNWNRNAFALDFGLGGNIPLGKNSKIKIETRYQRSLLDLSTDNNVDARTHSLLLNMGYLHRL
jgi:hypothetical protein